MKESQVINGWMREGERKGMLEYRREDLLMVVRRRLANPVPEEVRLTVEGTNDLDVLRRWLEEASDAKTLEELRAAMRRTS